MKYFLDTNIIVYALHRKNENVLRRMKAVDRDALVIPSLVAAELARGVVGSARVEQNKAMLDRFLNSLSVQSWDIKTIWHYAVQEKRLREMGKKIGEIDLLIGCQALAANAVFVTNNVREFERIEGLRLENWV